MNHASEQSDSRKKLVVNKKKNINLATEANIFFLLISKSQIVIMDEL